MSYRMLAQNRVNGKNNTICLTNGEKPGIADSVSSRRVKKWNARGGAG
jgi:hypothetical protein